MADNLGKKGEIDKTRINISQRWEIDYWVKELSTTETKLRRAVKVVGPMIVDVKRWLRDN